VVGLQADSSRGTNRPGGLEGRTVECQILGSLKILQDGRAVPLGGSRPKMVMAALILDANHVVSTDRLIDAVWDEHPPDSALESLRAHVSRLRSALGASRDRLTTEPTGYRLTLGLDELDAERFETLAENGRRLLTEGDPGAASESLREALGLWQGPALADFADCAFAVPHISRLEERRLAALEDRIEADLALGRHAAVVGELETLCGSFPLRERLWAQRITALYRSGRQAEALRAYQQLRDTMVEELGIEPSPELRELEAKVLRQDDALAVSQHASPAGRGGQPSRASEARADAPVRLMLVDDHPVWRQAMQAALEHAGVAEVVGEAADGEAAVAEATRARPDVILMDLHLPRLTGTEATAAILEQLPGARILMLSSSGEEDDVLEAVRSGARGYLLKSSTAVEVGDAVRRAATGEAVFSPSLASVVLNEVRSRPREGGLSLSVRQREVMRLLSAGHSYADIAEHLGSSEEDVRTEVRATVAALQGVDRAEGPAPSARAVRTVMFVDVVGSTAIATKVGDRQWRDTVQRYHDVVRQAALGHDGALVKTSGDGAMATFEQPTSAIRAAEEAQAEVKALGLSVRAGVHIGECEITSDDVHGVAVNIAARIADKAGPDEILVSHTVRDLVLGSDIELVDRGTHQLRGVPGRWRLFAVPS